MTPSQLSSGEWVVNVCNHFWWHYVYIFSLFIKVCQWILHQIDPEQFPEWKKNHTTRFKDGKVIEMTSKGKSDDETVEEWLNKQRRTITIYRPLVPFGDTPDLPYDFWGLPQKMLSYFRRYILRTGNTWNGRDGVPKGRDGFDCVEEVMSSIGEPDAHIWLPCRLPLCQKLEYVGTLETQPINNHTMIQFLKRYFTGKNLFFLAFMAAVFLFGLYQTIRQVPGDGNEWAMIVPAFVVVVHFTGSYLAWKK